MASEQRSSSSKFQTQGKNNTHKDDATICVSNKVSEKQSKANRRKEN
jgi:hypothetical protein